MKKIILNLFFIILIVNVLLFTTGCTTKEESGDNDSNKKEKVSIIDNMKAEAKEETENMFDYNSDGWTVDDKINYTQSESQKLNGVFKHEENGNTYYYYRGNVKNNYVQFGKNAKGEKIYWRIIRTNEDNTIRLIYAGTDVSVENEDLTIGKCQYNDGSISSGIVGYTSDTADSKIKKYLEDWYQKNIENTGYGKYVATEEFNCDTSLSATLSKDGEKHYGAEERIRGNIFKINHVNPSLIAKDTEQDYGGTYKLKVGMITADEVAMAGILKLSGKAYVEESYLGSVDNGYWTMSPAYESGRAYTYIYTVEGTQLGIQNPGSNYTSVRPVISINEEALKNVTGTGTATDPYIIK